MAQEDQGEEEEEEEDEDSITRRVAMEMLFAQK